MVNSIICCAKEAPHSTVCLRRTKSIKGWFTRHQICRQDFVKLTDIITISESWLNTTTSTEIQLDGYKLLRLDRQHKGGGGVCAYVRSELKSKVLEDFSSISDRNFHQLWLSVQVKKSKLIVLCVAYRPDDTPLSFFEDTLKPVYTQALLLNKPIIILGDLNCDGLNSSCREYAAINSFTREMNLQQLIKEPTRITATTESLLDVILVSDPSSVRKSGVINNPISITFLFTLF